MKRIPLSFSKTYFLIFILFSLFTAIYSDSNVFFVQAQNYVYNSESSGIMTSSYGHVRTYTLTAYWRIRLSSSSVGSGQEVAVYVDYKYVFEVSGAWSPAWCISQTATAPINVNIGGLTSKSASYSVWSLFDFEDKEYPEEYTAYGTLLISIIIPESASPGSYQVQATEEGSEPSNIITLTVTGGGVTPPDGDGWDGDGDSSSPLVLIGSTIFGIGVIGIIGAGVAGYGPLASTLAKILGKKTPTSPSTSKGDKSVISDFTGLPEEVDSTPLIAGYSIGTIPEQITETPSYARIEKVFLAGFYSSDNCIKIANDFLRNYGLDEASYNSSDDVTHLRNVVKSNEIKNRFNNSKTVKFLRRIGRVVDFYDWGKRAVKVYDSYQSSNSVIEATKVAAEEVASKIVTIYPPVGIMDAVGDGFVQDQVRQGVRLVVNPDLDMTKKIFVDQPLEMIKDIGKHRKARIAKAEATQVKIEQEYHDTLTKKNVAYHREYEIRQRLKNKTWEYIRARNRPEDFQSGEIESITKDYEELNEEHLQKVKELNELAKKEMELRKKIRPLHKRWKPASQPELGPEMKDLK